MLVGSHIGVPIKGAPVVDTVGKDIVGVVGAVEFGNAVIPFEIGVTRIVARLEWRVLRTLAA